MQGCTTEPLHILSVSLQGLTVENSHGILKKYTDTLSNCGEELHKHPNPVWGSLFSNPKCCTAMVSDISKISTLESLFFETQNFLPTNINLIKDVGIYFVLMQKKLSLITLKCLYPQQCLQQTTVLSKV